ncbi:helix-turn-helix transcriptional regulator [Lapidilactobacillus luobeiensis]|uniref:helix-turn-helix transcriptional regulator n=1 Tax=Lapidilactobacillus luobeiensis TaxID=2950371 RepID=UPI0021C4584C|nr:WYL domain-containing protein [Lapidilactobacillus luobeiensis]
MNSGYRQAYILIHLLQGEHLTKATLATYFKVATRSIQRDVSQLNDLLANEHQGQTITYDANNHGYALATEHSQLNQRQVLLLIKILLASRALDQPELTQIVKGLKTVIGPDDARRIDPIIRNEIFNYQPLKHHKELVNIIWDFSNFILQQRTIKISYETRHQEKSEYTINPEAIFFSEFYFYVISFDFKSQRERFFRSDRISAYEVVPSNDKIPYANRFLEGELRKHIQFMYTGPMEEIVFEFWGIEEAALDRLPTAEVIARHPERHSVTIRAQVLGNGVRMWLLSQGNMLKVLAPESLVAEMKHISQEMVDLYSGKLGNRNEPPHFQI